jgi:hypothetical protein
MRTLFKVLAAVALTTAAPGCSSFLDVNNNPNSATSATADQLLAQALATTAGNYTGNNPSYNSYASWVASYWGKTGVVSGYGEELTYNYSSSYYAGLFANTYDNLNDYALIQQQSALTAYPYHAAVARIMKAYNFQLLVDEYGDIPYTQALQGLGGSTTPKYDKAQDIYDDLIKQLDGAIADINATTAAAKPPTFVPRPLGAEDVVFGGGPMALVRWKQFANSLKLRILLRESQTGDAARNAAVAAQLAALQTSAATVVNAGGTVGTADGFINADVVVQPGYTNQGSTQQNPLYTRYAYTSAGTNATERSYQLPTDYILKQYSINNDPRLSQLYTQGLVFTPGAGTNGDGQVPTYIGAIPGEANSPGFNSPVTTDAPISGSRFRGANAASASGGIIKGLNAPTAIMLLSEHLFSKSEAEARGLFTGDAKADFNNGIRASFVYYYRAATTTNATINASTVDDLTPTSTAGITQYNSYVASNTTNGLVNWDVNTTTLPATYDPRNATAYVALTTPRVIATKQEKIIYQKYLALNSIASVEAWDDYRRTGFPKLPTSIQSGIAAGTRADRLPTRLLYPLNEISTNNANVPTGITTTSKIFWDFLD